MQVVLFRPDPAPDGHDSLVRASIAEGAPPGPPSAYGLAHGRRLLRTCCRLVVKGTHSLAPVLFWLTLIPPSSMSLQSCARRRENLRGGRSDAAPCIMVSYAQNRSCNVKVIFDSRRPYGAIKSRPGPQQPLCCAAGEAPSFGSRAKSDAP